LPDAKLSGLRQIAEPDGIYVKSASIPDLIRVSPKDFNKTHVPVTAMARLWINELLDPKYERFLYLDGDIDITSSLDPLLHLPIPSAGFLAAPDTPMLVANNYGKSARVTRDYLTGLGITNPASYFNDGILLVDRSGWSDVAGEAWEFFRKHPERCKFHEQSALNATAQSRRQELSLVWNYQTDFKAVADPRRWNISPAIWHFTGFPKPWNAVVFPWEGFGSSYRIGRDAIARAAIELQSVDRSTEIAAAVSQRNKLRRRLRWIYPWRRIARSKIIRKELGLISTTSQANEKLRPSSASETSMLSRGYSHVID
jgi:lipopolysaccharide biosynthesis glycosyltransferase